MTLHDMDIVPVQIHPGRHVGRTKGIFQEIHVVHGFGLQFVKDIVVFGSPQLCPSHHVEDIPDQLLVQARIVEASLVTFFQMLLIVIAIVAAIVGIVAVAARSRHRACLQSFQGRRGFAVDTRRAIGSKRRQDIRDQGRPASGFVKDQGRGWNRSFDRFGFRLGHMFLPFSLLDAFGQGTVAKVQVPLARTLGDLEQIGRVARDRTQRRPLDHVFKERDLGGILLLFAPFQSAKDAFHSVAGLRKDGFVVRDYDINQVQMAFHNAIQRRSSLINHLPEEESVS